MGRLTDGARSIAWIERHCRVPKGPNVGAPLRLLPFQKEILCGIFDSPTRRAIISLARQNGKTSLCACLVLLYLVGPKHQRNGLCVSSATTREQAAITFDLAAKMVRASPELSATVEIVEFQKMLRVPALGTVYRALSADAPGQLGLSPALTVHDELGATRGPISRLFDVLESGSAVQRDPLSIVISTQAASDSDLLSILIDDAQTGADARTKVFLWSAPADLDPFSDEALQAANPGLCPGGFMRIEELRQQAEAARRMPSRQPAFENLVLNRRTDAVAPFVSQVIWEQNAGAPSKLEGATVVGGLDLAAVSDLCALVLLASDGSVHPFFWLPEDGLAEKSRLDKFDYVLAARNGFLLTTPGSTVDYDVVSRFLRERVFDCCHVTAIGFDRMLMRFLKPALVRANFSESELAVFSEIGQGFYGMAPCIRELEAKLLAKKLRHGGHPILRANAAAAAVITDESGNRKFTKKRSTGRIDGLIALSMACGVQPAPVKPEPKFQLFVLGGRGGQTS